ncbi:MAG: ABC transporter permease [Planctomycetota bacterium]
MLSYVLRRLVYLLLTLFGISLIQFGVINAMPGRPSSGASGQGEKGQKADQLTTESDRKWRASFHLDKPAILNFRPWMQRQEVEAVLEKRCHGRLLAAPEPTDAEGLALLPVERMHAQWQLDDWGASATAHIVAVALDAAVNPEVRLVALRGLPASIQRRKILPDPSWKPDEEAYIRLHALNREIAGEDALAQTHILKGVENPAPADIDREALWWREWVAARPERFDPGTLSKKIGSMLLDTRYAQYFGNLLRLDFGETLQRTRVRDEIVERLPLTLVLGAVEFFLIYALALPLGVMAAVRRRGIFDMVSTLVLFLLYSLPVFYVGLLMVHYLTPNELPDWCRFPVGDWESRNYDDLTTWGRFKDRAWHSVLPLVCLVYGSLAGLSRFARTGMLDIIESDYIRTARAKGLAEHWVILKHGLRNAALPVLTLLGSLLPALFGGAVIVEVIFNLRGIGLLSFHAINQHDYTLLSSIMLISAVLVLFGMFLVDILYTLVDPRISFE